MKSSRILYIIYMAIMLLVVGLIAITPLIAFQDEATSEIFYKLFSPACHQKLSRSLCLFQNENAYFISDCTPQTGVFVPNDSSILSSETDGTKGYKFPVCSRDVALYFAMLLGGAVYPFIRKIEEKQMLPAIYFIAAISPIALDGIVQLASIIGMLPPYESTNLIRMVTGGLAGFAAAIYIIPIIMSLFSRD